MGAVVGLDRLLAERTVWRGNTAPRIPSNAQPTGLIALDTALPFGGWPPSSLSEILIPLDGIGELSLVFPTLARLTQARQFVAIVAPPYLPYAPSWHLAGIDLDRLLVIRAEKREALWSAEQCLRSAACGAVLCWPTHANDKSMRRLQVAAETGHSLGFAFRSDRAADNPSAAALRLRLEARPRRVHVIKCRGANPPARSFALPALVLH